MTLSRKPDHQAILEHITTLKQEAWLGPARSWWPDFLFRVDDVVAASKILQSGRLLSRAQAAKEGVLVDDAASPIVIGNTSEKWKEYVRLHFRPKTPTQFANEGFRPREVCRLGGAHCPAPIVMLFDAADVLTRQGTKFSDGNLAAGSSLIGEDAAFLRKIPFQKVYHSKPLMDEATKHNILYHRQAEVIIPRELDLSALRFIGCRSQAEYETLIHMLSPQDRQKWSGLIALGTTRSLHFKNWTFVEQVDMSEDQITIRFNPSTLTPEPFLIEVIVTDVNKKKYKWEKANYKAALDQKVKFSLPNKSEYRVSIKLDGRVAYANYYRPFRQPL